MIPPLITLEEHFFSAAVPASLQTQYSEQMKHVPDILNKLRDLGDLRRKDMAAGGVALQIISHAPGLAAVDDAPEACRLANDQLAHAIADQAQACFAGFAVLPMADPAAAAAELRRCVRELGFAGALVDAHDGRGGFFDGEPYDVFWEAAEELAVPVYLHPTFPASGEGSRQRFEGNFSDAAAHSMATSGFGWHADTALHVLRLFASGLFDRRPGLKVVVGHMGEMLPFMLGRICFVSKRWGMYARDFKTVWDENIWVTTSGTWSVDPMRCILGNTRLERILYSVDYPFQSNDVGMAFMRDLEKSGLLDQEGLERIAYKNAEELLGVRVP